MEDSGPFAMRHAATGGGAGLRLFAALHVPAAHAALLADHADALAGSIEVGRVSLPATTHLTWAFLGTVTEDYVPVVASALDTAACEVPGATMCTVGTLSVLGCGHALAVDVDVELLAPLDAARDRFLRAIAPYAPQVDQRAWRPHVTILRVRDGQLPTTQLGTVPQPAPTSWIASELCLYASLPGPVGRQHRVLHSVPFGASVHHG